MKFFLNIQEFSRTPEFIQGQNDVFQESRTKRVLIANSRTVLGAQGRLATLRTGNQIDSSTIFSSAATRSRMKISISEKQIY